MATPLGAQTIFDDVSSGVIQSVKFNLVPPNSADNIVNMVVDENYGESTVRKGITIKGSQLVAEDNTILGLYYFSNSGDSSSKLLASVNEPGDATSSIYYFDGASWVSGLTGDTAGLKTRFVTFLDEVVRLNGTDAVKTSANGTSWSTSTALDSANFPNGKLVAVYKDQLVVGGVTATPDTLFISSVVNTAGTAISWTTGDREIRFNPEDGAGNMTALGKVNGLLIVWKDRAMYTWNNRSTQADEVISVGCSSQESVTNLGGSLLAFFNPQGIWLTSGSEPVLISRKVQKWIDAISPSYYTSVASYGDGRYLYTSIGDCTVDGIAYNNIVLRYSVDTKEFVVYSYPKEFRVFSKFITSSDVQIVAGDTTARVYQIESTATTDDSTAIGFRIESQELVFGSRGITKEIQERIMAYAKNPQGALVQVKVDDGDWITLGSITKNISSFSFSDIQELEPSIRGNYFKFRVIGTSSGARFRLLGLELPSISALSYGE